MPAIWVMLGIILLNMTAFRGSKVVVTLFAIELGAPQFSIGAIIAMYSVFPMILGVFAGKLTDRLGVRRPLIGGTLGVALALLVPFAFPRMPSLYLSAILIGASWVFYNVCAQNLMGLLSTPETRAKNFSNFGLVMAGGSFFGPTLSGIAIDHIGYAKTYLVLAAIPLASIVVIATSRALRNAKGKGGVKEEEATYSANLLQNVPLRRTLITSATILTGTDLFQFYMPIYGHSVGLSASAIGTILGMFAVAAFVVRLVMPALVKRYTPDTVLLWALYIGAVAYVLFPMFETALLLAAVAFLLGLGMGCSQPVSLMLIYDRAPPGRSGEALGMRVTINNFMHIAVPMIFGTLGTALGVAPVFYANAAILAAGGAIATRARNALATGS
ncbi:MAG TPA: MFS transporter [Burkholderiales bacterium]|nr:MFS transporter [Burkholderiales bacterium]